MTEVMVTGKEALDRCMMSLGRILAERRVLFEREGFSGKDYDPVEGYQKWGTQRGLHLSGGPEGESESSSLKRRRR